MDKKTSLITYCGLYCGDCHGFQQKIPDLARDLRKELRSAHYDKFADAIADDAFGKAFKGYDTCYEVLGAMVRFRCHKGCRAGGGPPFCKIRACCQKREIEGCWQCDDFESCDKLQFLSAVHEDAARKNLRILKKKGPAQFVVGARHW